MARVRQRHVAAATRVIPLAANPAAAIPVVRVAAEIPMAPMLQTPVGAIQVAQVVAATLVARLAATAYRRGQHWRRRSWLQRSRYTRRRYRWLERRQSRRWQYLHRHFCWRQRRRWGRNGCWNMGCGGDDVREAADVASASARTCSFSDNCSAVARRNASARFTAWYSALRNRCTMHASNSSAVLIARIPTKSRTRMCSATVSS